MTTGFSDDRYQRLMSRVDEALPTKVVCLMQAVSLALLEDDKEYKDILEDMISEGKKYGNLVKVVMPRPDCTGASIDEFGKVFLEYADVDASTWAKISMHRRWFDGNRVVAVFYPENKYADGDYDYEINED